MTKMRLQRLLARAGVTSRRKAEVWIAQGRVRVDGKPVTVGASADPEAQRITLDGRPLRVPDSGIWLALHKPVGVAVTRRDPAGRPTVFELAPRAPGLTYVGRLDLLTSGLLLLTTDGTAAHRLTHPSFAVPRTYRVVARGLPAPVVEARLASGIVIDGRPVAVQAVRARPLGGQVEVTLTLGEGRNRIVRRLCAAMGVAVESLQRIGYGPVRLGRLEPGRYRSLTPRERRALERVWSCGTAPS